MSGETALNAYIRTKEIFKTVDIQDCDLSWWAIKKIVVENN